MTAMPIGLTGQLSFILYHSSNQSQESCDMLKQIADSRSLIDTSSQNLGVTRLVDALGEQPLNSRKIAGIALEVLGSLGVDATSPVIGPKAPPFNHLSSLSRQL